MVSFHVLLFPTAIPANNSPQPSATGQNWEKYQKEYADDEVEEKKITPLTDEYEPLLRNL